MQQKILVTNFNYNMSTEEYKDTVRGMAQQFADVPGCTWKIWLLDEAKKEAGAVYFFTDDESLQNFKASPLVAAVLSHPALSNFDLKERDIIEDITRTTRGPVFEEMATV